LPAMIGCARPLCWSPSSRYEQNDRSLPRVPYGRFSPDKIRGLRSRRPTGTNAVPPLIRVGACRPKQRRPRPQRHCRSRSAQRDCSRPGWRKDQMSASMVLPPNVRNWHVSVITT
jgi:hypothetical protein